MKARSQLPRVVEGQLVPNVSRREMKTLGMIVDEHMEFLPRATIDLTIDTERENFRYWLLDFINHAAGEIEWAYRRATDSALEQAHGLLRDPHRYERQRLARRERLQAKKERRLQAEAERQRRINTAPPVEHVARFWNSGDEISASCAAGDWHESEFQLRAEAQEAFDRHLKSIDPKRGLN